MVGEEKSFRFAMLVANLPTKGSSFVLHVCVCRQKTRNELAYQGGNVSGRDLGV